MKQPARVVVVDDNEAGRYAMAHCLRQAGYAVIEGSTAADCFNALESGSPDLILLDINLPDGSGIEICRKLKSEPNTASIPVIQMSAVFTAAGDRATGLESGADAYLASPFDSRELLAHVQSLLRLRQSEAALRQSEARFRTLFEQNPEPSFMMGGDGRFLLVNSACEQLFGRPATDLQGRACAEFCAPDCHEQAMPSMARALQQALPQRFEAAILHRDGHRIRILVTASPILQPGHPPELHCTARDITAERHAAEALQLSEQRLRVALEAAQMGTWVLHLDTGVVETDALHRRLWDIDGDDPHVPAEVILNRIHPEDTGVMFTPEQFANMDRPLDMEFRVRRRDGEVRWLKGFAAPVKEGGRVARLIGVNFDITPAQQAEEALRKSEEMLQAALDAGEVMTFSWDVFTDMVRRSPNALSIMGEPFTGLGKDFFCRVHPDYRESMRQKLRSLCPERPDYTFTYKYLSPSRGEILLEDFGRAQFDSSGKLIGLSGVARDVTKRTRAEQALRDADRRLASFLDNSALLAWMKDEEGRFVYLSDNYVNRFKFAEKGWQGKTDYELWPKELADEFRKNDRLVLAREDAAGPLEVEEHGVEPDGSISHWLINKFKYRDSSGRLFVGGLGIDITQRTRTEEALRESRERLRLALAAASAGVWDWNIVTGAISWSPENYRLFGRDPAEGPLSVESWSRTIHPEDLPGVNRTIQETLESLRPDYESIFRVLQPEKGERWLLGLGKVEFNQAGKPVRMHGINIDITVRKRFEAELERLVAERTAKLKELVAELEHFSYTITHDMRAPLRIMRGLAELVQEDLNKVPPEEHRASLRRMITSIERMDRLITDALNYSQAVRQQLPLYPVDPGALLRGMLDSYPEFQSSKARIDLQPDLPLVFGNEAGLTQVFSNLLNNAIKFVQPGKFPEIRIRAELLKDPAPGKVSADHTPTADPSPGSEAAATSAADYTTAALPEGASFVRISVEDNGIGISDRMLRRVFNMFSRGSGQYEGTGIGLALVRKVMDRMNGRVGVHSEPGKGSCFYIDLLPGDFNENPALKPTPTADAANIL